MAGLSTRWSKFRETHPLTGAGVFIGLAIGAVLIGVVIWANVRKAPNNPEAPGGTQWKCQNGHEFTLTSQQLDAFRAKHYGEAVACPTCGAPSEREIKCPHCGNLVVPPHGDRDCPVCHQPLSH